MIVANGLTKIYHTGKTSVHALDDVSIKIESGKICCIIGKSGSGKSTLLRQLSLIDTPTSGHILIDGVDTSKLKERERSELRLSLLGYVFQEYSLLPELTAIENVILPALQKGKKGAKERAAQLLTLVGLEKRLKHTPRELSGGEQQRVAIARSFINEPKIIFADEPTANLDTVASLVTMHALTTMSKESGVTVVFVTHDPDQHGYASQLVNIRDGKLVEVHV